MLLLLIHGVGMGGVLEASPTPPPVPTPSGPPYPPSGGRPYSGYEQRRRSRRELSEARRRFGLEDGYAPEVADKATAVISDVAARQADRLETDQQKIFDELLRELELQRIEFDRRYLAALTMERQRLIDQEIGQRLRRIAEQKNEEEVLLLLLMAASIQ